MTKNKKIKRKEKPEEEETRGGQGGGKEEGWGGREEGIEGLHIGGKESKQKEKTRN